MQWWSSLLDIDLDIEEPRCLKPPHAAIVPDTNAHCRMMRYSGSLSVPFRCWW
jgi:hypothetical protein